MGSVPVFSNTNDPYGTGVRSPQQIDKLIGSAYDVVRDVAENLEYIKHVSAHLVQIYRLYQSVDGIDTLYENIEGLELLLAHLDEIILVAGNMDDLISVAEHMVQIDSLYNNMFQLLAVYENLDAIIDAGGVVIVSDTRPDSIHPGKLWWDSDSGDLFAYYNDGSSGQWVQINIANPVYSWTDITGKPTTFPPSGHTHNEYVKDTGDTMTGTLTISTPATVQAAIYLNSVGVTANAIVGQTANAQGVGVNRWSLFLGDTTAESGTAAQSFGSDFKLRRHRNDGNVIDYPISIPRSTGVPHFEKGLTTPTPAVTDEDTSVATTGFVNRALDNVNSILGNVFKVYGKDVIYIPDDPEINKYSLAYGDGLKKLINSGTAAAPVNHGKYNLALGFRSLLEATTGTSNTMAGYNSGLSVTTGNNNVGMGVNALYYLTTGGQNTAVGTSALYGDPTTTTDPDDPGTAGDFTYNTGVGYAAINEINSGAQYNVGLGAWALSNPTVSKGLSGRYNNGVGGAVMHNLETGIQNQAMGYVALGDLISGNNNIAIGHNTGRGITTGSGNVVIGHNILGLTAALTNTIILGVGTSKVLVGSPAGVSILGTTTNDAGLAGYVGEYLEINVASGAAVTLTTNAAKTVAQLVLTAGDWDVHGWLAYTTAATTSVTRLWGSVSMSTNVIDNTTPGVSFNRIFPAIVPGAGTAFKETIGYRRVSIAASGTVYLTALGTFTVATLSAWGKIWARRVR